MEHKWINPYWTITEGFVLRRGQKMINGEIVQTYADNDGGLWYYDSEGKARKVEE